MRGSQRKSKSSKKNQFSFKRFITLVGVFSLFIISVVIILNLIFDTNKVIISGINWYEEEIIIKVGARELKVDSFDMFSFDITSRGNVLISVQTVEGKTIHENQYFINSNNSIILELLSPVEENQCIISADVSEIYYEINESEEKIRDVSILSNKSTSLFQIDLDKLKYDFEYFVYPGNYQKDLLPEELLEEKKVMGVFFVECGNIDNEETLRSDILGSIYYEVN